MYSQDDTKKRVERFRSKWASLFKPLTVREGLEDYAEFVAQSDPQTIEFAIDLLSDQFQTKKAENEKTAYPNLGSLKAVYFQIKKSGNKAKKGYKCTVCDNSGYVLVLMYNKKLCDPRRPLPAPIRELEEFAGSCNCSNGDFNIPMKTRNNNVANSFGSPVGSPNSPINPMSEVRRYSAVCNNLHIAKLQEARQLTEEG